MINDPVTVDAEDDLEERAATVAGVIEYLRVEAAVRRASADELERRARELQLALVEMEVELARRQGRVQ